MNKFACAIASLAATPFATNAACAKVDVQFLLESGFTVAEARLACASSRSATFSEPGAADAAASAAQARPAELSTSRFISTPRIDKGVGNGAARVEERPKTADANDGGKVKSGLSTFTQGWGIGLAALRNKNIVINDASIVNGVVRANAAQVWQPELLLARHWYFSSAKDGHKTCTIDVWGSCLGMFLALGIGGGGGSTTNQVVDMAGAGLLVGFGAGTKDPQEQAHNLGIGIGRRFNVRMLGDGISANAPLPNGETQIRYKTEDITAPFIFYTYKFGSGS